MVGSGGQGGKEDDGGGDKVVADLVVPGDEDLVTVVWCIWGN